MMFITVVDKLIKQIIIFNNKHLQWLLRCGQLVSNVWIVGDYRGVQDSGHCYPQVILKAGAIKLGSLP